MKHYYILFEIGKFYNDARIRWHEHYYHRGGDVSNNIDFNNYSWYIDVKLYHEKIMRILNTLKRKVYLFIIYREPRKLEKGNYDR